MADAVAAVVAVAGIVWIAWICCMIADTVSLIRRRFVMGISGQRYPVTEDRHDKPYDE